jgi:GGDEF domain-containing protein
VAEEQTKLDIYRKRNPRFDDVSDDILVNNLWESHYQDIDADVFREIMGVGDFATTREGEFQTEIIRPGQKPFRTKLDDVLTDPENQLKDQAPDDLGSALDEFDTPPDHMAPLRAHAQRNIDRGTLANTPEGMASVRSGSVNHELLNDGRTTLIPFQWDGEILDPREATQRAIDSGIQWPAFDSIDEATAASKQLSGSLELNLRVGQGAWADPERPGYFSNIARRGGERMAGLVGSVLTTTSTLTETTGRAGDVALAEWWYDPGLERDVAVNYAKTRPNFFATLGEHLQNVDYGSVENYGKEKIEEAWDKGEYLGMTGEIIAWGIEEGAASIPDMIGVMYALPSYITARSGEMGTERAKNDGRDQATTTDIITAIPAAIGSALFERWGASFIIKQMQKAGMAFKKDALETAEDLGRNLIQRVWESVKGAGKTAGMEGFTEAVQEGVFEYLGETWGTDVELSARKAAIRGFWGALAGFVFGGTAGGLSTAAKEAGHAISALDAIPEEFLTDPDMRPDPDGPRPDPPTRPGEEGPPIEEPPADIDADLAQQSEVAMGEVARLEDEVASLEKEIDQLDPADTEARLDAGGLLAGAEADLQTARANQTRIDKEIERRKFGPPPERPRDLPFEVEEDLEKSNAEVTRLEGELATREQDLKDDRLLQTLGRVTRADVEASERRVSEAQAELDAERTNQTELQERLDNFVIEDISELTQADLKALWEESSRKWQAAEEAGDVALAATLKAELDTVQDEVLRREAAGELEPAPSETFPPPDYTPTTEAETLLEDIRLEIIQLEFQNNEVREQLDALTPEQRANIPPAEWLNYAELFASFEERRIDYVRQKATVEQLRADRQRPGREVDEALAKDIMDVLRSIRDFGPNVDIAVNAEEMAEMVARAQRGENLEAIAAAFWRGELESVGGFDVEAENARIEAEDEAEREIQRERLGPEFRAYEAATRELQELVAQLSKKYGEWERFDYDERIGTEIDTLKEQFDELDAERDRLKALWQAASPVVRTSFAGTYEMAGQEFEFENALDVNPQTMQLIMERMSEAGMDPTSRDADDESVYGRQDFHQYAEEHGYDGIIFHGWPQRDFEIASDMGFDEELMDESVEDIAREVPPPTPPTDITPPPEVTPTARDWRYVDPRMKRQKFRDFLRGLKEEFQSGKGVGSIVRDPISGEVTGRITSPNPLWVQEYLSETGMTVEQVHNAIDKALAGQRLGHRQEALVKSLLDKISDDRQEKYIDAARKELKKRRDERRNFGGDPDARIEDEFYDKLGENFAESDYWNFDDQERIINDLAYRLVELGLDPDPILARSRNDEELIRRLEEALYDYEAGTRGLEADAGEQADGPQAGVEAYVEAFEATGWRVEGLAPDQIYTDAEAAYPIFGPAGYFFFNEADAGKFAEDPIRDYPEAQPEITSEPVVIASPYRIRTDAEYKALVTASGWDGFPNPMQMQGTPEERLAKYQEFANGIREYLATHGFDGVVIEFHSGVMDVDVAGNPISLIRDVFDTPQMIVFAPSDEALAGADDLAGYIGARIFHEGVLAEYTGATRVIDGDVQYEVLFLAGGRRDTTAWLPGDPMERLRADQALADEKSRKARELEGGETDLSDTPLFGPDQGDIFDLEGVETGALEQVRRKAQIRLRADRTMETLGEQLGEDFLLIDDAMLDEFIQRMDEEFAGDLTEALDDFYELTAAERLLLDAIISRIDTTGERRGNTEAESRRREVIDAMTHEQRLAAIYTDELTGLGNKRLLNENIMDAPFVLAFDLDNLSVVNDELGRDVGDKLLQAMADVIKRNVDEGFHTSGSNFVILGDDLQELSEIAAEIEKDLAEAAVGGERGELRGLKANWGVAPDLRTADQVARLQKQRKLDSGEHYPRGVVPPNLTLAGTTDPEIDAAKDPMAEPGDNYIPMIGKTGELPLDQDNNYVLSDGRRVRIPKKAVRKAHIIRYMKDVFGLQIYTGRVKGKTWLGFYRKRIGEIRTKFQNDLEVTAHEVGHWFDDRYNYSNLYEAHKKELNDVSYDSSKTNEGFAEFFRLYLTQEHEAQKRAPFFFEVWKNHLDEMSESDLKSDREMAAGLRDVQEMMHAWYLQGAGKRLDSKIGNPNLPLSIRFQEFRVQAADYVIQKTLDQLRSFKQVARTLGVWNELGGFYQDFRKAKVSNEVAMVFITKGTGIRTEVAGEAMPGQLKHTGDEQVGDMQWTGEALNDIFRDVADNMDNFVRYMVARRGRELYNQGREHHLRPDEIVFGLKFGVADERFEGVFDRYQAWNSRMMDYYVQSGIVSESSRQQMEAMNHDYVPFNRIIDALNSNTVQRGTRTTPFQRLRGGTANLNDVMDNIHTNTSFLVHMAMVNQAKRGLYDAIDNAEDQAGAMYAVRIPREVKSTMIPREQVERAVVHGFGLTMREWRHMTDGVGVVDEAEAQMVERINAAFDTFEPFVQFWQVGVEPTSGKGDQLVDFVFRNGRKDFYEIMDPMLMDSINHVGPQAHNLAVRILGGFSNLLRRTVTSFPLFQFSNWIRDTMQAWTLTKGRAIPIVPAVNALFERMWDDTHYWEYVLNGGGMATIAQAEGINADHIIDFNKPARGLWEKSKRMWRAYDRALSTLEYANRLAEFKELRRLGYSKQEAAFAGREISTDFAMRGSSDAMRVITISIPFLNARMQGGYRLAREAYAKGPAESVGHIRWQSAMKYASRAMIGITIPTIVLYFMNKDDWRYKDMPDWMRDMNWVIFYGWGEDDYVLMPKPFETGLAWATVPERTIEYMYTNDEGELADALGWMFMETFALDVRPQAYKPIDEIIRNKKWTGAPVVPAYLEDVIASQQYKHYTSDAMVALGKKMGISPLKAEHLVSGYAAQLGQYSLAVADFIVGDTTNGGQKVAPFGREVDDQALFELWGREFYADLPETIFDSVFLQRIKAQGPLRRTRSEEDFYDLLKAARTTANTVQLMKLRDLEGLREYLSRGKEATFYGLASTLEERSREVNKINSRMDAVAVNPDMTGVEKRDTLNELQRFKNQIHRATMQQLDVEQLEEMEALMEQAYVPPEPESEASQTLDALRQQ